MNKFLRVELLNNIIENSKKEPLLIFKHSLTCPISAGAYDRIIKGFQQGLINYPIYLVVVQNQRDLSNSLAETLAVKHESPQLILVKDGKSIYDASHDDIRVDKIPKL